MIHDPIADMLTRMRNAIARKHRFVNVLYSSVNKNILSVLIESGFVERILVNDEQRLIRVYLKYSFDRDSIITDIQRVSTPGRRKYARATEIPVIRRGLGRTIVSTSKGVMCGEKARKQNIGGEPLCAVW